MHAGVVAGDRHARAEDQRTDREKQHDRGDLDQREPELHLGEPLHANQVHRRDDAERDERENPLRNARERCPVMHVERDGGDVDDAGHRPVQEVHPACDERCLLAQEFACVRHEAAAAGTMHHEFAERAQDQERERAAHEIDDRERRPGGLQPGAGPEEQPRADCPADRDHLHLSIAEGLVIAGFVRFEPAAFVGFSGCRRFGNRCHDCILAHGCDWNHPDRETIGSHRYRRTRARNQAHPS